MLYTNYSIPFKHIKMTITNFRKSILSLLAILAAFAVTAQTNLDFNKYTLVSGTDRHAGAVYRFTTVKSGVDAMVTIDKLTRSASLDSLDFTGLGFTAALQPQVSVTPHCWGYVQFNIQFVAAGSSNPVAVKNIPAKGNNYKCCDDKDVKLDVLNTSATSFKVRMYLINRYGYTLNRKADVFLQKFAYTNTKPSETATTGFANEAKGN